MGTYFAFLVYHIILFCLYLSQQISKQMAHNVPAVYDVFSSPIKETVRFSGLAKMWVEGAVGA
jgi:hypothetical protein